MCACYKGAPFNPNLRYKHSMSNAETKYNILVREQGEYCIIIKQYSIEVSILTILVLYCPPLVRECGGVSGCLVSAGYCFVVAVDAVTRGERIMGPERVRVWGS